MDGPPAEDETRSSPSGDPLLVSKLTAPHLSHPACARMRLLAQLSAGARGPLTLVSAPAGYGKTVLVSQWCRQATRSGYVAWLTLDDADSDPGLFWFYVVEAIRSSGLPLAGLPTPSRPDQVTRSFLATLSGRLAHPSRPVTIVLDDWDLAADTPLMHELDFVIRRARPSLHVVLLSRTDPVELVTGYRLRGDLTEIRASDLAFTPAEATELLELEGIDLDEDLATTLVSSVNGWPACVRLAALGLQRTQDKAQFVDDLALSSGTLADYLVSEVLDKQPDATRDFLLRTSILERIWPDLADTLTGRSDGDRTLSRLEREFGFVRAAEPGQRCCYQYDRLFRELLRMQARYENPQLVPELRLRAARWLSDRRELAEAVDQAAAVDWQAAASLLVDQVAVGLLATSPSATRLTRSLSSMPVDTAGSDAAVVLAALALALADARSAQGFLDSPVGVRSTDEARPALRLARAEVRAELALVTGNAAVATAATSEASELLDTMRLAAPTSSMNRAVVQRVEGAAQLWVGRLDVADNLLRQGLSNDDDPATAPIRVDMLGRRALGEAARGNLRAGSELVGRARDLAERTGGNGMRQAHAAHAAAAWIESERGALTSVQGELDRIGTRYDTATPLVDTLVALVRARTQSASVGPEDALHELQVGRSAVLARLDDHELPSWLGLLLAECESDLLVSVGDPHRAIAMLTALPTPPSPHDASVRAVALARARLASGDPASASSLVLPILRSRVGERAGVLTDALLVHAHAMVEAGRPERALREVAEALTLARPEQRRRPFALERSWLAVLVARSPVATRHHWVHEPWARTGASGAPASSTAHNGDSPVVVGDLSAREHEVLSQLALMMSTDEIAEALFLSPNTVKTHLKSIYRKLGASRRSEAVRRARTLELL